MQRIVLLACLVVGLARVLVAQQTAPTFRAGVEVVQLDVSVLDKDRRPMHGLTTADFTILEDGKPQKIVAFTPVDMPEAPPPLPAGAVKWPREVPPDVQTNAVPEGRLFVLLIDDAMIPFEPRIMANARDAARKVIDHLGPTDQMAVLFTDNSAAAQNFTNDREKLLAAVEKLRGGRAGYLMGWDTAPAAE